MHSVFQPREKHDGTLLSDRLEIHTVELTKLGGGSIDPEDAALVDWVRFLAAQTDEERRRLAMTNRDIRQANQALEQLSQDPEAQRIARWREDQLRLYRMELATAERRGREEGREEGLEKGLQGTVRALCEMLGIELGPDKANALSTMRSAELSTLVDYLKRNRSWPEH